jgi:hypothetical protein
VEHRDSSSNAQLLKESTVTLNSSPKGREGNVTPPTTITGDSERDHELLMLGRAVLRIVEANGPEYETFRTPRAEDHA